MYRLNSVVGGFRGVMHRLGCGGFGKDYVGYRLGRYILVNMIRLCSGGSGGSVYMLGTAEKFLIPTKRYVVSCFRMRLTFFFTGFSGGKCSNGCPSIVIITFII